MRTQRSLFKTIKALQTSVRELKTENRALRSAIGHAVIRRLEDGAEKKGRKACAKDSRSSFPFHF